MIQRFLNNYFGFNKQQRNGLYVLCCISILLLVVRLSYPAFIKPVELQIENLPLIEEEINTNKAIAKSNHHTFNSKATLFPFDPNTASLEELVKLGIREKTALTLIKFRSKGFKFKQKEDLKKIYGLNENIYLKLEPYILIKTISGTKTETKTTTLSSTKNISKLELNSADSLSLIALKGVGPGYAKRIIKYRSMLGGFANILQLKEVYGMTDELFTLIESQCKVNSATVTKLDINTLDFKLLNKHPYISYELTKQICNFRKTVKISEVNIKDVIQDDELTNKLSPYLLY